MKLASFQHAGRSRIGRVEGDHVVDLAAAAATLPQEMVALLEAGAGAWAIARDADGPRLPLADVTLEAPLRRPPKILAVGLNYRDHAEEAGMEIPKVPMIFNKQSTSVHPPGAPFHLPRASDKLDYEGELAFVIGRRCRHVPEERAHEVIAGFTIVNDVSVRDWQMRVPTFTMGKSFDTHCPLGPWIVSGDEIDPHTLAIRTWVNGELRQDSNTKHLIFDCFALVAHLTEAFTLEPGDVVATGTPAGVGAARKPRSYLEAGDEVRIAIEGIGELVNSVIAEPAETASV
jgi:2-keto-4-pentenoate hydratase/2-oxohepta-3-ene-1,7-dioic acid hydratase in catechol pathway